MREPLIALGLTLLVFAVTAAIIIFILWLALLPQAALALLEETYGMGAAACLFAGVFGVFMFGIFWLVVL
jgi:hypothetical protein